MSFERVHLVLGIVVAAAMTSLPIASAAPSPVLIEAESMAVADGLSRRYGSYASGAWYLNGRARVRPGTARASFPGASGNYDIRVGYFDETDGQSAVEVKIDGASVASWVFDADINGVFPSQANATIRTVAENRTVAHGALIEIAALADKTEYSTLDFIEFVPAQPVTPVYDTEGCLASEVVFEKGLGCWVYHDTGANADKPVRVWYYNPPGYSSGSKKIVFALHGSSRDAHEAIERWYPYADIFGALIIAPEFSRAHYPKERHFGRGNVRDDRGEIRAETDWTFSTIDEIFALARQRIPGAPEVYSIQGHSAGAQFVHRKLLLQPDAPIATAVAASAGWYLNPDEYEYYPCGVADVGTLDEDLKKAYAKDLVIALGTDDVDTDAPGLNHDSCAEAQGANRYERGHFFYTSAQEDAWLRGQAFNWTVVDVSDAGHDADSMVEAGVDAIFSEPLPFQDIVLSPTHDATVKARYPYSNYGRRKELQADGNSLKITYMQFDLRAIQSVNSAILKVKVTDPSDGVQNIKDVVGNNWNEATLTYSNRPAVAAKIATVKGGRTGGWLSIDITGHVAGKTGQIMSIAFDTLDSDGLYFNAKEASDGGPELVIRD